MTRAAFSVEPSTSPSGCVTPLMSMPGATMQQDSAKCTPSIISATRSSPNRSRDSSSASAVSVIATASASGAKRPREVQIECPILAG